MRGSPFLPEHPDITETCAMLKPSLLATPVVHFVFDFLLENFKTPVASGMDGERVLIVSPILNPIPSVD